MILSVGTRDLNHGLGDGAGFKAPLNGRTSFATPSVFASGPRVTRFARMLTATS